jgi:hypothetical protein
MTVAKAPPAQATNKQQQLQGSSSAVNAATASSETAAAMQLEQEGVGPGWVLLQLLDVLLPELAKMGAELEPQSTGDRLLLCSCAHVFELFVPQAKSFCAVLAQTWYIIACLLLH